MALASEIKAVTQMFTAPPPERPPRQDLSAAGSR
jgi:hypothetical protein